MKKLILGLIVLAVLCLPARSFAWGMLGHRIVGEIASKYLTPQAKTAIEKILGNETLALASTWADYIKSDTNYRYLNAWHYADFKENLSYNEFVKSLNEETEANAYNKMQFLIKELKKKSLSLEKKQMYLRLLVHIAGDVHQPFHSSEEGDQGGNQLKVMWFNEPSNIHRVWDEHLIEYQQLSYTEYVNAINFTTASQRQQLQKQPMAQWLFESYKISTSLRKELKPEQRLSYAYNFKHVATLNNQLLKGGVRLAGILNQIFGS